MRNTKALQPCRNLRQCKGPIDGEMDVMLNSKQADQFNHTSFLIHVTVKSFTAVIIVM